MLAMKQSRPLLQKVIISLFRAYTRYISFSLLSSQGNVFYRRYFLLNTDWIQLQR
jgi:hypothetical protein